MKNLTPITNRLHPGAAGLTGRRWLQPLFCILLLALFQLSAAAQTITADFTDGFGTDPAPADEYPGSPGNGWYTSWFSVVSGTTIIGPNVITSSTPGYNPLNGGGNYINWGDAGTGSTKNAVSVNRAFDNSVLNFTQPYTIEWDLREEAFVVAGVTNTSLTSWNTANDYVSIQQTGTIPAGNDVAKKIGFWVKAQGATTSTVPSLKPKFWNFFDGNLGSSAETAGVWINSTVPFVTGDTYHFKITVDPINAFYQGAVTDLVTSVGFSTTAAVGRPLRWQSPIQSTTDFIATTNLAFVSKENAAANTNYLSLDSVVITQFPTNSWPPQITPIMWDTTNLMFVPERAKYQTINPTAVSTLTASWFPGTLFAGDTFYPYTSNFIFTVVTPGPANTLPASGIKLFVNGVDKSSGLSFTGSDSDTNRTVTYSGLQDNTVYTNVIVVTDSAGNVSTNMQFMNTFDLNTCLLFEAENFDFDPMVTTCDTFDQTTVETDRFIEGWLYSGQNANSAAYENMAQGYYALAGTEGIDYQCQTGSKTPPDGNFRVCMPDVIINNEESVDFIRPQPFGGLGLRDNTIRNVGLGTGFIPNMWFNYTYVYPANGTYVAYIRAGGSVSNFVYELDKLASGYGTSTQTSNYLAQFNVAALPSGGQLFDYPLVDASGHTAIISLSGKTTLKLSVVKGDIFSNGNSAFSSFTLLPVPPITITNVVLSGPNISFSFNSIPTVHYTVQFKSHLTDATWSTLNTVVASGTSTPVSDTLGLGNRFYRVSTP